MSAEVIVSNLAGLTGAILTACSIWVQPLDPEVARQEYRFAKETGNTPWSPYIHLRRWQFRLGLGLVALSYLLPLATLSVRAIFGG